jgi:oligopeptide/dipeptide ABC transporter ATP-binding protein
VELSVSLLKVNDLKTCFYTKDEGFYAVNGVSFTVEKEKTLGIVGESGCGKSVTALSIMGLIRKPCKIESGQIYFNPNGETIDLTKLDPLGSKMRSIRGNQIAMVFQEPMNSLNPVFSIGFQIMESIELHQRLNRKDAREKTIEILRTVGIPAPAQRFTEFPHQLSGGMRQRAMIGMALSCNPSLLIADEPTTALDVTIQAQVLKVMNELKRSFKTSIIFITHDLGVIAHMADDVIVMYLGTVIESAPVRDLFSNPLHPYTRGLIQSIPSLTVKQDSRLKAIKGMVPDHKHGIRGCGFEPRCPHPENKCRYDRPFLVEASTNHHVACWI